MDHRHRLVPPHITLPKTLNGYDLTGATLWFQFHADSEDFTIQIYFNGALIMAFPRNGCLHMGWANYVQEIIIGAAIVVAVAIDRFRSRA